MKPPMWFGNCLNTGKTQNGGDKKIVYLGYLSLDLLTSLSQQTCFYFTALENTPQGIGQALKKCTLHA